MQEITRRAALRGGTAVACAAAAGMVAAPVLAAQSNPDARVFALIEKRGHQLEIEHAARIRCGRSVRSLMPPELRGVDLFDIFDSRWKEANKVFMEIHERPEIKTLFAETAPSTDNLKPADVAAKARKFTVAVECWK